MECSTTADSRRDWSLWRLALLLGLVSLLALPAVVGLDVLSAVLTPLH
jgi:hypothetical protein